MTPLACALAYAQQRRWPVFPCRPKSKAPLLPRPPGAVGKGGFYEASLDPEQITLWWRKWPLALIGIATETSRLAVLDVDVKDPKKFGPDSLADLGRSMLDDTWIAHTPSGGWHCYYHADPDDGCDIPSTTHKLGSGLDVRARGAYIIAPSPGSGYRWGEHCNPNTLPLAPAPGWLIPPAPEPEIIARAKPVKPNHGLAPYADAAIARACLAIRGAADGQQRVTLLTVHD
jgi:putative DNA primase/helicase